MLDMNIIGAYAVPHPPLIIPEVGRGQEQNIQATADSYERIGRQVARQKPDVLVVISPHSVSYADYLHISPVRSRRISWDTGGISGGKGPGTGPRYHDTFVLYTEICRLYSHCAYFHFGAFLSAPLSAGTVYLSDCRRCRKKNGNFSQRRPVP